MSSTPSFKPLLASGSVDPSEISPSFPASPNTEDVSSGSAVEKEHERYQLVGISQQSVESMTMDRDAKEEELPNDLERKEGENCSCCCCCCWCKPKKKKTKKEVEEKGGGGNYLDGIGTDEDDDGYVTGWTWFFLWNSSVSSENDDNPGFEENGTCDCSNCTRCDQDCESFEFPDVNCNCECDCDGCD